MLLAFFRYLNRARDEHSLHSPFLFALYTQVIRPARRPKSGSDDLLNLRNDLRRSRQKISVTDFGAGSKVSADRQRTIGDIARSAQKSLRFARLLFRLVQRFQARTVLDLGTSLGVTTAFLAEAARPYGGRVITFEGCLETAAVARQTFEKLSLTNVEQVVGNLDETLAPALAKLDQLDFVFFDANHRYEPTVRYFEICLTKMHNDTVFVLDDIHWSAEMERAWAYVRAHPSVSVTVDLFWVGLVFFRQEQPRQDFILRY